MSHYKLNGPVRLSSNGGRAPIVVAYGAGTNSTALLVEMVRLGEPVDAILFADTGGERPSTYAYVAMFSAWLVERDYPAVTVVQVASATLEEDCLRRAALPALSYGFKTCSLRFKQQPQTKWLNNWDQAKSAWARGQKVVKLIGYDMDEPHRGKPFEDDKFVNRYPLLEWDWGREECVAAIAAAGLPQPGKSSCFFCPSMTKPEILQLRQEHPELLIRAEHREHGEARRRSRQRKRPRPEAELGRLHRVGRRSRSQRPHRFLPASAGLPQSTTVRRMLRRAFAGCRRTGGRMSRLTIARLKEILSRTEQARARSKMENPHASAVRGQLRRDEEALREAIELISGERP